MRLVYTRMLIVYITIILLIMMGQTFLLGKIYQLQYTDQQKASISSEAEEIASLASVASVTAPLSEGRTLNAIVLRSMAFAAQRYQGEVWMVWNNGKYLKLTLPKDEEGKMDINSPVLTENELTNEQRKQYLTPLLEGKIITDENKSGFPFGGRSSLLTMGYPISVDGVVYGGIIITSRLDYLSSVMNNLYRQISFASVIALVIGMLLVMWSSSMITKPIKQMGIAAKEIAKGNFDRQVDVVSDDEIGELADSFNKMAGELKKQEALRKGFVANVSHELKSPLTSIQGFAQGMLDGTIPMSDSEKYLNVIVSETRRLNKLIRELLDLSQIESGKFPLNKQVFDINEHLRLCIIKFEERIEAKKIEIDADFDPERSYVNADPDRIDQVITNLIDNAVKFTPEGGVISIWSHGASDRVLVGVKDSGPGIPREEQEYVWERFYKVDKSHTGKQGTGLGLSIVQKIIEEHGERITLKSEPGDGCAFVFSLQKAHGGKKEEQQLPS